MIEIQTNIQKDRQTEKFREADRQGWDGKRDKRYRDIDRQKRWKDKGTL